MPISPTSCLFVSLYSLPLSHLSLYTYIYIYVYYIYIVCIYRLPLLSHFTPCYFFPLITCFPYFLLPPCSHVIVSLRSLDSCVTSTFFPPSIFLWSGGSDRRSRGARGVEPIVCHFSSRSYFKIYSLSTSPNLCPYRSLY